MTVRLCWSHDSSAQTDSHFQLISVVCSSRSSPSTSPLSPFYTSLFSASFFLPGIARALFLTRFFYDCSILFSASASLLVLVVLSFSHHLWFSSTPILPSPPSLLSHSHSSLCRTLLHSPFPHLRLIIHTSQPLATTTKGTHQEHWHRYGIPLYWSSFPAFTGRNPNFPPLYASIIPMARLAAVAACSGTCFHSCPKLQKWNPFYQRL